MRMHRVIRGRATTCIAVFAGCLLAANCLAADAQDLPPQNVGGTSTLDTPPDTSGNQPTPGRHRLSTLTVVPEDFATLKLSPGFLITMDVSDAPEFSSDLRIDANGDVTVSQVGAVHIAGQTLTEAAATISRKLQEAKILNHPQINLNVAQYAGHSITVLGEVHNPGRMELLAPHNLADVLAMSGGETQYAGNLIEIRRTVDKTSQTEVVHFQRGGQDSVLAETEVRPGDTITVRRAGIVYVLGGVNRPGGYIMQENGELSLTEALALAYGTKMEAAVGSIRIIRKTSDGRVEDIPISYRAIEKGKEPPPKLQAEDVVYVPISKTKTVLSSGLLAVAAQAAIFVH